MGFLSRIFSKNAAAQKPVVLPESEDSPIAQTSKSDDPYLRLKKQARDFLDAGFFHEAEGVYRQALAIDTSRSEAHVNLGYVLIELQRPDEATSALDRAIDLDEASFDAHFLRGQLAIFQDDLDVALEHAVWAQRLEPESVEGRSLLLSILAAKENYVAIEDQLAKQQKVTPASLAFHIAAASVLSGIVIAAKYRDALIRRALWHLDMAAANDGKAAPVHFHRSKLLRALDDTSGAIASLERAIELDPTYAAAHFHLALVNNAQGNREAAVVNLKLAIQSKPDFAQACKLLGDVYYELRQLANAIDSYKLALSIDPQMTDAEIMLATAQSDSGASDVAFESCKRAIALRPDAPEVYFAQGNIYAVHNRFAAAVDAFEKALRLAPSYVSAMINMGAALLSLGQHAEAIATFQRVLEFDPNNLMALSNIAYCSSFDENCSPEKYLSNAGHFGKVADSLAKPYTSWQRDTDSSTCLKVGIVSGDLGTHPVGFFLESVLSYVDTDRIQFHVFSNHSYPGDALQVSLKSRVSSWTEIAEMRDEAAAKLVHEARLDLLLDLSGHTGKNRLALFAWRAAPVQASWLGYWASTGVEAIDYVVADPHCVPEDSRQQFSEKVTYLPHTRLCFTPPSAVHGLPVSALPSIHNKQITFGSFQPLRKLTKGVLDTWGEIASLVPDARFRLQNAGFNDPSTGERLLKDLADAGIASERVSLHGNMARLSYLKAHGDVDIILDTFPYPGGTTTCDALWMGVPTLTLAGNTMLARQGVSINTCAGLTDWIAQNREDYVKIAVSKAADVSSLAQLRATLRQQVFKSALFDAPNFGRDFEACLQAIVREKLVH